MDFIPQNVESDSEAEEVEQPQEDQPQQTMKLTEHFDQHKLHHILQHREKYKALMRLQERLSSVPPGLSVRSSLAALAAGLP